MISLAALVLLSIAPAGQDTPAPEQTSIDRSINDLGSPDAQVRERAEAELKKMGRDAVPALREAARSGNAERALRARALLLDMAQEQRGKDRPAQGASPAPRVSVL